jgi:FkbM family methyltransferase
MNGHRLLGLSKAVQRNMLGKKLMNVLRSNALAVSLADKAHASFAKANQVRPNDEMLASIEYFNKNADRINAVCEKFHDDESRIIYRQMIDFRCKSNIDNFPANVDRRAYFYNNFFIYEKHEVFIDCGAFIGDSIRNFKKALKRYNGNYKQIVAFEPDPENFKNIKRENKLHLFNAGVYDREVSISFEKRERGGSRISHDENDIELIQIPCLIIDNIDECSEMTFLKMDIEGAEMKALIGAEKTILKRRPKLAICIYHSNEEMIDIPEYLMNLLPKYKFFIRQHIKYSVEETVLYGTL